MAVKKQKHGLKVDGSHICDSFKPRWSASVFNFYRYATAWDIVLLFCAVSVSVLTGLGPACFADVSGQEIRTIIKAQMAYDSGQFFIPIGASESLTNHSLNGSTNHPYTTEIFYQHITECAIKFSLISIMVFIASYLEVEDKVVKIKQNFFKSILHQDMAWFDQHQSGEMTAKLSDNLERIREGMGDKLGLQIQVTTSCVAGFIVACLHSWKLGLIVSSLAPLLMLGAIICMNMVKKAAKAELSKNSEAGTIAEEVLSCIRTVIAFNGQKRESTRYKNAFDKALSAGLKRSYWAGLNEAQGELLLPSFAAVTFWYGTIMVNNNEIDRATLYHVLLTIADHVCFLLFITSGAQLSMIAYASGAAESIFQIIDREPEIDSYSTEGKQPSNVEGRVEFANVSFKYPCRKECQILNDISFAVQPGETVALVGFSGCGKSTILNLLLRFYDPNSGQISIDGEPIETLNINFLRNVIGIVGQEPVLFARTVEENIRLGNIQISHQEMISAAEMANAHHFISSLPDGYQTLVGERGVQLSGGQKQRIAIARTLVRQPKILLLDEATSALDAENESIVQEALEKAAEGRTTIIVAHRLTTIRNADRILVMEHGEIVENGKHMELMQLKGLYYQLQMRQVYENPLENNPSALPLLTEEIPFSDAAFFEETNSGGKTSNEQSKILTDTNRVDKDVKKPRNLVQPASFFQIFKENFQQLPNFVAGFTTAVLSGCLRTAYLDPWYHILVWVTKISTPPGGYCAGRKSLSDAMNIWCLLIITIGIGQVVINSASAIFFGHAGENLSRKLRMKVFQNVLRQNVAYFDDPNHSTGKIATRLGTEAPNVKAATDQRLGSAVSSTSGLLGAIALAVALCWQLGLFTLVLLPAVALPILCMAKLRRKINREHAKIMEEAGQTCSDAIQNIKTVQALTREPDFYKTFCEQLSQYKHSISNSNLQGMTFGISNNVLMLYFAAVFQFGGFLTMKGFMEPTTVYRVFIAMVRYPIIVIATFFPEYTKAKFSAGLLFEMINQKPQVDNLSDEGIKPEHTQN